MNSTTKVKNKEEIKTVKKMYKENGFSIRKISRILNFSRNTIRKIIRRTNGYENEEFDREMRWKGREKYSSYKYESEIDKEILYIQKSKTVDGYLRFNKNGLRTTLHRYEAKKVFQKAGRKWDFDFIVHHIDLNRINNSLSNLNVFPNNKEHRKYHGKLSNKMYDFLLSKNLIIEFFKEYPELKLISLKDILNEKNERK